MSSECGVLLRSEYRPLRRVMVCPPVHYAPTRPINRRQVREKLRRNPVLGSDLLREHVEAVSVLRGESVDIVEVDPDPTLPYQFNIRDAVFAVANKLFLARMRRSIRAAEPARAARHVGELGANHLDDGTIEGGDILVDDPFVIVGLSDRTSKPGVASLTRQLTGEGLEVLAVPLTRGTLHLDTVLCCMPDRYLVDTRHLATPADTLSVLGRRRRCHMVSPAEAENFATNMLLINEETVLAASGNGLLASTLRSDGFRVIEVDMRAHHRIGGSVRCMTAPLRRA